MVTVVVFRDPRGHFRDPGGYQWWFWDAPESGSYGEVPKGDYLVSRVEVPRDVFRQYSIIDTTALARLVGTGKSVLVADGASKNVMKRVKALQAIATLPPDGLLDSYPDRYTRAQLIDMFFRSGPRVGSRQRS